jgi:Lon protease-like protein
MPLRLQNRYEVLPDEDLQPSHPVPHVEIERQAESMRELRRLHNDISASLIQRDQKMQAWALSNSLSRHDMAMAIGMHKSRVDQIIRELTLHDQAVTTKRLMEQMRRHVADEDEGLGGIL